MQAGWAVLADYALVDATGKLSVIGIFDRLTASEFPSIHPILFVVVSWVGPPSKVAVAELRLWGPGKELLVGGQQQVQLGLDGHANGVFRLSPIALPQAGSYVFELLADAVSIAHLPLEAQLGVAND
jgi:hypothetical protein